MMKVLPGKSGTFGRIIQPQTDSQAEVGSFVLLFLLLDFPETHGKTGIHVVFEDGVEKTGAEFPGRRSELHLAPVWIANSLHQLFNLNPGEWNAEVDHSLTARRFDYSRDVAVFARFDKQVEVDVVDRFHTGVEPDTFRNPGDQRILI